MSTTDAATSPLVLTVGEKVEVRPSGGNRRPWVGVIVPGPAADDPPDYLLQHAVAPPTTVPRSYLIVQCLHPCDAPGIVAGKEYLVLQRFVRPFTRMPRKRRQS